MAVLSHHSILKGTFFRTPYFLWLKKHGFAFFSDVSPEKKVQSHRPKCINHDHHDHQNAEVLVVDVRNIMKINGNLIGISYSILCTGWWGRCTGCSARWVSAYPKSWRPPNWKCSLAWRPPSRGWPSSPSSWGPRRNPRGPKRWEIGGGGVAYSDMLEGWCIASKLLKLLMCLYFCVPFFDASICEWSSTSHSSLSEDIRSSLPHSTDKPQV